MCLRALMLLMISSRLGACNFSVMEDQELAPEPDALASSTARTMVPCLMLNLGIGIQCSVPSFSLS